ncbi:Clr5 domain-containing protein [Diaporthe sp. PMI_573]|nr:Clr5 domain-containing protein [Diaporthaceae sp. PMI_573]
MRSTTASSPTAPTPSPAQMHSISRKKTGYKPSPEQWEAMRLTIQKLYINENKTLAEVSKILGTQYSFDASPKQYKNRFQQWGLWKNLSTRDAARLIQMKASRDSIGKTSTFVRAGQKLDFDRVQKTMRRGKQRIPRSAAEEEPRKPSRAEPAPPACNQPSRVECRTPSPEPLDAKDELDMLDILDPNCLRVDGMAVDYDFSDFGSDTFHHTHVSDSILPFSSLSDAEQFDPSDACHYRDPRIEFIWDIYARVHHRLALRCEWLRTEALSDPVLRLFRRDNALLAMLEPLIATNGNHAMRELFVANFVSSFLHRPEFSQFALHVQDTIGQAFTDTKATSYHATVVENALQYLGLQTYTRRFIEIMQDRDPTKSPPSSDERISSLKTETSDGLSPDVYLSSPRIQMPFTPPGCNDYDNGPGTDDFEGAAFAYHLGETEPAEARLRALTCYDGSGSTKGQVLMRLAWYCLSRVQRESGRVG